MRYIIATLSSLVFSFSALANEQNNSIRDTLESIIAEDNDLRAVIVTLPPNKKDDGSYDFVEFSYDEIANRITVVTKNKKNGHNDTFKARFDEAIFIPTPSVTIHRGDAIDSSNLTRLKFPKSRNVKGLITNENDVIGKVAKRNLRADRPLNVNDVTIPVIIEKGEKIKMVYSKNHINIEADGMALESGGHGSTIKARNTGSGKNVLGTVVDSKTILISN
jgi:flagella basal body P-ring formation protein FlgA